MSAQAIIFDLSEFGLAQPVPGSNADQLLDDAIDHGLPCALITELPHEQAEPYLTRRFGGIAHHIFSVVLTGVDFKAHGHKAPYSTVLRLLGIPPDDAMVVATSSHAVKAARTARIDVAERPASFVPGVLA
ncbi:HAD hydrolase-like protein [Massilia niastensis]|uniref:HAD hydrolase-like protein n=1 Tax=Massilia niastensis TaxID=544911 RepID=UPI0003A63C91|nr:HAD hydrolase-like protein [Massilia niastensis]